MCVFFEKCHLFQANKKDLKRIRDLAIVVPRPLRVLGLACLAVTIPRYVVFTIILFFSTINFNGIKFPNINTKEKENLPSIV